MKTITTLFNFLVKSFVVLGLIAAAGAVGVGVAAVFAMHEIGGASGSAKFTRAAAQDDSSDVPRVISLVGLDRWQGQKIAMNVSASLAANRFVAAEASDKARFTYADYQSEPENALAQTGAPNILSATPAPLDPALTEAAPVKDSSPTHLTDPGSHYIVDAASGRVIGIDGTAGAVEEARQQQKQQEAATVAASHEREVRAALPVEDAGFNLPPPKPELYPAVRRALPAVDDSMSDQAGQANQAGQPFNASAEVADDGRPVLRAQPVLAAQPARQPRRLFTFP